MCLINGVELVFGTLQLVLPERGPFCKDYSAVLAWQVLFLSVLVIHVLSANMSVLGCVPTQLAHPAGHIAKLAARAWHRGPLRDHERHQGLGRGDD